MFRWARSCEERHDVTERLTLSPFLVDDYDNSDKWLLQSWNEYHLPFLKNKPYGRIVYCQWAGGGVTDGGHGLLHLCIYARAVAQQVSVSRFGLTVRS